MKQPRKQANATPHASGGRRRLLALDTMRGITIAGMILVNNPGSWSTLYAPLRHAEWNGLTPTDLVFPFFMFIMGVSTFLSMRKFDFRFSMQSFGKVLRRTVLIFLIGLFLAWLGRFMRGAVNGPSLYDAVFNFDTIRIMGVLPRLALSYGLGATLILLFPRRAIKWSIIGLLAVYAVVLLVGHGYEFSEENVLYIVDNAIMGDKHVYHDMVGGVRLGLDPEGLLGVLPSVAHMLIGFLCGAVIADRSEIGERLNRLFVAGTVLTFVGFLLSYGLPMNKKIWSPTFVLTTCGLAASLLALLIWIIDMKGYRRWTRFFEVFGVNPLFLFCMAGIVSISMSIIRIGEADAPNGYITLHAWLMKYVFNPLSLYDGYAASLLFALFVVAIMWGIGYFLYRKKIFIKI